MRHAGAMFTRMSDLAIKPGFASTPARVFFLIRGLGMGLATLIIGLIVFIGAHVFITRREARAGVIARMGEELSS